MENRFAFDFNTMTVFLEDIYNGLFAGLSPWQSLLIVPPDSFSVLPGHWAAQLENLFPGIPCQWVWTCDKVLPDVGNFLAIYKIPSPGLIFSFAFHLETDKLGPSLETVCWGWQSCHACLGDFMGQSSPTHPLETITQGKKSICKLAFFVLFCYVLSYKLNLIPLWHRLIFKVAYLP